MKEEKWNNNPWMFAAVGALFSCFGSTFFINSYAADKYNINWLGYVLAVVFGIATVYCFWKLNKTSTGTGG